VSDILLEVSVAGKTLRFSVDQLPVTLGGRADSDVLLDGTLGELQLGTLDDAWFVQVQRGSAAVQLNGVPLRGTQRVDDGDILELEGVRLNCTRDCKVLRMRVD